MKKTPLAALVLAAFMAIPACGCPEEECVDSGEPDVGYDAGTPDSGADAGSDAGEDGGSDAGEDGGNANLPPVAVLKYRFSSSDPWTEVYEGDLVTKPLNSEITFNVCYSQDPDGIIVEARVDILGDGVGLVVDPCDALADTYDHPVAPLDAFLSVEDDHGAVSKLLFRYQING